MATDKYETITAKKEFIIRAPERLLITSVLCYIVNEYSINSGSQFNIVNRYASQRSSTLASRER